MANRIDSFASAVGRSLGRWHRSHNPTNVDDRTAFRRFVVPGVIIGGGIAGILAGTAMATVCNVLRCRKWLRILASRCEALLPLGMGRMRLWGAPGY